jgi:hypothetical protein
MSPRGHAGVTSHGLAAVLRPEMTRIVIRVRILIIMIEFKLKFRLVTPWLMVTVTVRRHRRLRLGLNHRDESLESGSKFRSSRPPPGGGRVPCRH